MEGAEGARVPLACSSVGTGSRSDGGPGWWLPRWPGLAVLAEPARFPPARGVCAQRRSALSSSLVNMRLYDRGTDINTGREAGREERGTPARGSARNPSPVPAAGEHFPR
ncbi:hypothetical protein NDU88_000576 [Pleurodeles waltl]|uniref:Uncharacterized protein n=1 Tax=Pleurodeles waltl TaxID=8319 RepID=A0AAV7Q0M6_PLEWA|nr:hypothetical protein NDU88_000576 [Pleurodeles waltl]